MTGSTSDDMSVSAWAERCLTIEKYAHTAKCDMLLRYFDIRRSTSIDDARWQPFQLDVHNDSNLFWCMNKARQIGASFTVSADSLPECLLNDNHTIINISFNLEEAKEKIQYFLKWWESKHPEPWKVPARGEFDQNGNHLGVSPKRVTHWPEIVTSNVLEVRLSNGSRFISHPCRPPRGKRASVNLDEFAHYQGAGTILQAALPMITRGRGLNRIKILSSPKGAEDKFWEIMTDVERYPDYRRFNFGWWEISDLCEPQNRLLCLAAFLDGVSQVELVERYGTAFTKMLWNNTNPKEDFYQEFGLAFLDSAYSFITWALIRACHPKLYSDRELEMADDEAEALMQRDLDRGYKDNYVQYVVRCEGSDQLGVLPILNAIDDLRAHINTNRGWGQWFWAYDCGRQNDASEIVVLQLLDGHLYQRGLFTMAQVKFEDQRAVIRHLLESIRMTAGYMDKGGIGMDIAETMTSVYGEEIARPADFTNDRKDKWAKSLKRCMEKRLLTIIANKEQDDQLHSVKRVSQGNLFVYTVDDNRSTTNSGKKIKHHADKFWALALATYLAEKNIKGGPIMVTADGAKDMAENAMVAISNKGFSSRQHTGVLLASGRSRARDISERLREL